MNSHSVAIDELRTGPGRGARQREAQGGQQLRLRRDSATTMQPARGGEHTERDDVARGVPGARTRLARVPCGMANQSRRPKGAATTAVASPKVSACFATVAASRLPLRA